ncbi:MAG: DNA methyltransferase, partial [Candidatus Alkanophagales archaeon]
MNVSVRKANVIASYIREIHNIYTRGDFTEPSFYPCLQRLFEALSGDGCTVISAPKKTKAGFPDFIVRRGTEIVGYIEAKPLGADLEREERTKQLQRYRNAFPNLILTNFLQFRLYGNGKLVSTAELCDASDLSGPKPPSVSNKHLKTFLDLVSKFYDFSMPEIQDASRLASVLAKKTKFARDIILEELKDGDIFLSQLLTYFKHTLIEGLTDEKFADLYAQTLAYGLFAAKVMAGSEEVRRNNAWMFITMPLLRKIFHISSGPDCPEALSWVIDDICGVLNKVDVTSLLSKEDVLFDDPIIHFYDTFIGEYDPTEKKRLGIYYTPVGVVAYIVASAHKLLQTKFGLELGLAEQGVKLLDPAAGTLTFVIRAIGRALAEFESRGLGGLIPFYIKHHILKNFYAFEISLVPYVIGHLRVAKYLEDRWGYKLGETSPPDRSELREPDRFQFYLTNTLEMRKPSEAPLLMELTEEGKRAEEVKERIPILVVLGNPPYSVSSENKSKFIEELMQDYKRDVRGERNIQPLSDDYIKFIRFAQWKLERTGKGILAFITNNAYLDGVIHRGMRKRLLETFDEIYILNLHGSLRKGETPPNGERDENIFDIQQGVAIGIFVKLELAPREKKVYYADLWGTREEKLNFLRNNDVETTNWTEIKPAPPYYFFVPKDFSLQEEYEEFWRVTDIFEKWSSGVETGKDDILVGFTPKHVERVFSDILDPRVTLEDLKARYDLRETSGWKIKTRRKELLRKEAFSREAIIPYAYRPFDTRFTYYCNFLRRLHHETMKNLLSDNLALVTTRFLSIPPFTHILVTDKIGDATFISTKTKERAYFFPLYLYDGGKRRPNFKKEFLSAVRARIGEEPAPEELFYYI